MSIPKIDESPLFKFLEVQTFGITKTEAQSKQICISCKRIAKRFKTPISKQEYQISAMCQKCQDEIFTE